MMSRLADVLSMCEQVRRLQYDDLMDCAFITICDLKIDNDDYYKRLIPSDLKQFILDLLLQHQCNMIDCTQLKAFLNQRSGIVSVDTLESCMSNINSNNSDNTDHDDDYLASERYDSLLNLFQQSGNDIFYFVSSYLTINDLLNGLCLTNRIYFLKIENYTFWQIYPFNQTFQLNEKQLNIIYENNCQCYCFNHENCLQLRLTLTPDHEWRCNPVPESNSTNNNSNSNDNGNDNDNQSQEICILQRLFDKINVCYDENRSNESYNWLPYLFNNLKQLQVAHDIGCFYLHLPFYWLFDQNLKIKDKQKAIVDANDNNNNNNKEKKDEDDHKEKKSKDKQDTIGIDNNSEKSKIKRCKSQTIREISAIDRCDLLTSTFFIFCEKYQDYFEYHLSQLRPAKVDANNDDGDEKNGEEEQSNEIVGETKGDDVTGGAAVSTAVDNVDIEYDAVWDPLVTSLKIRKLRKLEYRFFDWNLQQHWKHLQMMHGNYSSLKFQIDSSDNNTIQRIAFGFQSMHQFLQIFHKRVSIILIGLTFIETKSIVDTNKVLLMKHFFDSGSDIYKQLLDLPSLNNTPNTKNTKNTNNTNDGSNAMAKSEVSQQAQTQAEAEKEEGNVDVNSKTQIMEKKDDFGFSIDKYKLPNTRVLRICSYKGTDLQLFDLFFKSYNNKLLTILNWQNSVKTFGIDVYANMYRFTSEISNDMDDDKILQLLEMRFECVRQSLKNAIIYFNRLNKMAIYIFIKNDQKSRIILRTFYQTVVKYFLSCIKSKNNNNNNKNNGFGFGQQFSSKISAFEIMYQVDETSTSSSDKKSARDYDKQMVDILLTSNSVAEINQIIEQNEKDVEGWLDSALATTQKSRLFHTFNLGYKM